MNRTFLKGAALVLVAALVLAACNKGGSGGSANAQSGGRGGVTLTEADFKYAMTEDGSGVKLLEYLSDKGGNLIIPDTIEGFPVVALGDIDEFNESFSRGRDLRESRTWGQFRGFVEHTNEEIETAAKKNNATKEQKEKWARTYSPYPRKERITSITIPDTVTFIGGGAFWGCEGLKSITFPKNLKVIGYTAFLGSGLTSVTIPDGVMVIHRAFAECKSITTVTIGTNVQIFGGYDTDSNEGVFRNNPELTTVTIGENVQIGTGAFRGNKELATVNIPTSAKFVVFTGPSGILERPDNDAFRDCPKLNITNQNAIKAAGYTSKF